MPHNEPEMDPNNADKQSNSAVIVTARLSFAASPTPRDPVRAERRSSASILTSPSCTV